ncbi:GspE/PulE family protein [Brucepastera parasyntrophica]|uniref:GspE/PulE family protein n=1 Tax=Brucepastera parasyntrophica TaxID=2880008 RepID=UPI002109CD52|nr:GspE/PulE family protein [Brucepastera parasyntrophica]ULQ59030.1 GspE/PulE family protein [Brucepastera parasyntrophica]
MKTTAFDLGKFTSYRDCPDQYEPAYIRSSRAVKVTETETTVTIAIAESSRREAGSFLESFHTPKQVEFITVPDSIFTEFIGNVIEAGTDMLDSTPFAASEKKTSDFSLNDISPSSPVINIINAICLEAIRRNASDIHIGPFENILRIRFRLDGVLHTVKTLPASLFPSIASRIKIMSNLNIMEQRQPQDGRMHVTIGSEAYDLRVSIVPIVHGESIVLRFFNVHGSIMTLENLGFYPQDLEMLRRAVKIPNGLVLATGPTGSGKTTTLHALIREMDYETKNIITIEDPIERVLHEINQIQVNYEINLTFENMLRRVLRQDPNVIMVGEIRDTETAELALRAALTGHILLSTLHTNDSISAVSRLTNMGIEPFLIASVLRYVIAQRLVRKICPRCKKEIPTPASFKKLQKKAGVHSDTVYEEQGCEHCNYTGFSGRTVVAEIFAVNNEIEKMICDHKSRPEITDYVLNNGMITMELSAIRKVTEGITTINEIMREALICNTVA